jgi:CubicO group peptidase (beta-lactamase class C family)
MTTATHTAEHFAIAALSAAAVLRSATSIWQTWKAADTAAAAAAAPAQQQRQPPPPSNAASSPPQVPPGFDLAHGDACAVGETIVGPEEVGAEAEALQRVRILMNQKVASGEVPMLACSVVKGGRQVLCAGVGHARDTPGEAPGLLRPDTILRFYSMTKAVTTLTTLLLVEDGQINLDDPISVHLSSWDDQAVTVINSALPAQRPITVRDLMCHTSGLTYGFRTDDKVAAPVSTAYRQQRLELPHPITEHQDGLSTAACASLSEFVQRLNRIPLAAQPGAKFEYSVSTDVLGALLEEVSGMSLETLFQRRVFEPLKMKDTSFVITRPKLHRLASCYRSLDVGKYEVAKYGSPGSATVGSCEEDTSYLMSADQARTNSGGGGLLSTLNDYTRFASCLAQGGTLEGFTLIRPETLVLAQKDQLQVIRARHVGVSKAYQGYGLLGGVVTRAGAPGKYLPADAAAGQGTFAWGGAAGTYFFVDTQNALACVFVTQLLGYRLGAPTLRPEMARAVYEVFPSLRAKFKKDCKEKDFAGFSG